uniref:G-protein coupled receptors family 1 profile domain-containing protein n=1 Tax=Takifugu rubripes TaxID=31033 RepID=A0A3B5KI32_TAKRU
MWKHDEGQNTLLFCVPAKTSSLSLPQGTGADIDVWKMLGLSVQLLATRIIISCIGIFGNVFLIVSVVQNKFSQIKSFELFLLELAAANLEEILIVNIYDMIILQTSFATVGTWSCRLLKFLTMLGENASILVTVLISIFRYQKLRDASRRVNLPIYLDSIRSVWTVSGILTVFTILLSSPIFVLNIKETSQNFTNNGSGCPPDFFQCNKEDCPELNGIYKYLFILLFNLLPLIIVTVTSCLIIAVLLSQRKTVTPVESGSSQISRKSKGLKFQRSTIAVLTAMGLFQVDWTIYLIFQLTISPGDSSSWAEIKFFISTSYTSISPYVYGIGNNLLHYCTVEPNSQIQLWMNIVSP